jgi:hypothetical protein
MLSTHSRTAGFRGDRPAWTAAAENGVFQLAKFPQVRTHDLPTHRPRAEREPHAERQRSCADQVIAEAVPQHIVDPRKRVGLRLYHSLSFIPKTIRVRARQKAREALHSKQRTRLDDSAGRFVGQRLLLRWLSVGVVCANEFAETRTRLVGCRRRCVQPERGICFLNCHLEAATQKRFVIGLNSSRLPRPRACSCQVTFIPCLAEQVPQAGASERRNQL